jgi:lysyl-tRNA synthetase class 2
LSSQDIGKSLAEIIAIRRKKIEKIRELGFNPYEYEFLKTHSCKEVIDNYEDLKETIQPAPEGLAGTVNLAGRIMSLRRMGRASFCHIQDEEGKVQLYFQENKLGKLQYELFKLLDIGDIIGVSGTVFKTKTGEVTIFVEKLEVLAKSIRPLPIVKEKDGNVYDAFSDKESRYRQRYLDMIVNPEVKEVFKLRNKIIEWTRDFLNQNGFLEVETPALQPIYGGASARPFKTYYNALDRTFYLRIADELYLKRLIIGGFEKVYEISKDFRNEGIDRIHNPEFTALEFYQAYVDYEYMMDFVEKYFKYISSKIGKFKFEYNGHIVDFNKPFARKPMFELLKEYVGLDFIDLSESDLREVCQEKGIELNPNDHYGKYIEYLFSEFVEPNLIQPTFVKDFPKAISPFAKPLRSGTENLAERFELIICSQEFANSFSELNDPFDQRKRFEKQKSLRDSGDEEAQMMDEDFLTAMEYGMPPTGGVGIGMDRVIMFFSNRNSIKDVIIFPHLKTI